MKKFFRGAKPTPRHKLCAAVPHKTGNIPAKVAYVPKTLSYWLNNQYGDCVTAEEAFNKDVSGIFIQDDVVQSWASANNFLDGANLTDVMDAMAKEGFNQDGNLYNDGGYTSVDYSNEENLQSALAIAPVKIGIDADALPEAAGNQMGWYAFGGSPQQFTNEDHCVALCGYGPADWLFAQLNAFNPTGTDPSKTYYLLFTWSTIGVVDHDWIMSTVGEAWLRNPSSITNGNPLPNPKPKPNPTPPAPPLPPVPPTPPLPVPTPVNNLNWIYIAAASLAGLAVGALVVFLVKK